MMNQRFGDMLALSALTICRPPLKSGRSEFFDPKDAQCSETNEKTIFRFLRFFFLGDKNIFNFFFVELFFFLNKIFFS